MRALTTAPVLRAVLILHAFFFLIQIVVRSVLPYLNRPRYSYTDIDSGFNYVNEK